MASTAPRRRKRQRVDDDGDPEFQVAPMIDVLLVLMLFFMAITSTEVLKKEKNLQLPEASHAKQDKDRKNKENELVVNVTWDTNANAAGFSMDGIRYPSAEAMQNVLQTDYRQNPHAYVLIRADKDVEYSNISDLMNVCATVGIGTVTFAVITKSGGQKTAETGE